MYQIIKECWTNKKIQDMRKNLNYRVTEESFSGTIYP
jgi:hypothetical protein